MDAVKVDATVEALFQVLLRGGSPACPTHQRRLVVRKILSLTGEGEVWLGCPTCGRVWWRALPNNVIRAL